MNFFLKLKIDFCDAAIMSKYDMGFKAAAEACLMSLRKYLNSTSLTSLKRRYSMYKNNELNTIEFARFCDMIQEENNV